MTPRPAGCRQYLRRDGDDHWRCRKPTDRPTDRAINRIYSDLMARACRFSTAIPTSFGPAAAIQPTQDKLHTYLNYKSTLYKLLLVKQRTTYHHHHHHFFAGMHRKSIQYLTNTISQQLVVAWCSGSVVRRMNESYSTFVEPRLYWDG